MPRFIDISAREKDPGSRFVGSAFPLASERMIARGPEATVQTLAQGGAVLGQKLTEVAEHRARVYTAKSLAEMRATAESRMKLAKETAPEDGKHFTRDRLKELDEDHKRYKEAAPMLAGNSLSVAALNLRGNVESQALATEVTLRIKKTTKDLQDAIRMNANAIVTNTGHYKGAVNETMNAIDTARLPGDVKRSLKDAAMKTYTGVMIKNALRSGNGKVIGDVRKGKYDKWLTPSQKRSIIRSAGAAGRKAARAAKRAARAEIVSKTKDTLAAAKRGDLGTTGTGMVSFDELKSVYGEAKAEKIHSAILDADGAYVLKTQLSTAGPAETRSVLESLRPSLTGKGGDYRRQAKDFDSAVKFVAQRDKAIAADPAGYTLRNDATARTLWSQASTDATKMGVYTSYVLDSQAQMGVPKKDRRIMSESVAASIGENLIRIEDPVKRGDAFASLANQFGDHWPQAFRELAKAGKLPAGMAVYGLLTAKGDGITRRDLAQAMKIGVKDLNASMDTDTRKAVEGAVQGVLAPLYNSLRLQGGGEKTMADVQSAVGPLAKYYVRAGMSPQEAAQEAFKRVIGSKYHFGDTYRIPKIVTTEDGQKVITDNGKITAHLRHFLNREVKNLDIDTSHIGAVTRGLSREEVGRRYKENLARTGKWVTSSDESGVVLVDEKGNRVQTKDGKPVYVPFAGAANTFDSREADIQARRQEVRSQVADAKRQRAGEPLEAFLIRKKSLTERRSLQPWERFQIIDKVRKERASDYKELKKAGIITKGADGAEYLTTDIKTKTPYGERPVLINLKTGDISTALTITVPHPTQPGAWTILPSIWNGKQLSESAAIKAAQREGYQFPTFGSSDEASARARQGSEQTEVDPGKIGERYRKFLNIRTQKDD